jgi:hypothetical protein
MTAALNSVDPGETDATRQLVIGAAEQAVADVLDQPARDALAGNPQRAEQALYQAFKQALNAGGSPRFGDINPDRYLEIIRTGLRQVAADLGLGILPKAEETSIIWAEPLGVLTTDHVGYASFDLTRLRTDVYQLLLAAIAQRMENPDEPPKVVIWVDPFGLAPRTDALAQGRFALDAIVARLAVPATTLPAALRNMGPQSLQNPDLTDWRMSPASFAASPKTLLGENGCEELVPANIALQEFVLRQVVRLSDKPPNIAVPEGFKLAYVDDYKVSWYSLGHSLGDILYSLPLAPGESVKLAVIDWSWDSLAERTEDTKVTENLLHQTHRDRTITETVKAGLRELQHGSSFMAGTAGSAGATGSGDAGKLDIGVAVGSTFAIGGSTASSDGSRDLVAENVQRLSDVFSQASSSQRELSSTVVV